MPLRLQHSIEYGVFYLFYLLLLLNLTRKVCTRQIVKMLRLPSNNLALDLASAIREPRRKWPSQTSLSHPFRSASFFTKVIGLTPSEFNRFVLGLGPMPSVICYRPRIRPGRQRVSDGQRPMVASNQYVSTIDGLLLLFFFMRGTETGLHLASHFFDHDEGTLLQVLCMFVTILHPFAQYMLAAPEVLRLYMTQKRMLHFRDVIRRWANSKSLNVCGFVDGTCRAVLRPFGISRVFWSVFHDMYGVTYFMFTFPDGIKVLLGPVPGYDSDCGILAKCPWTEVFDAIWSDIFPPSDWNSTTTTPPSIFGDGIFPCGAYRWLTSSQGLPPAVSGAYGFLRAPNEHEIGLMNKQWVRLQERRSVKILLSTHRLYTIGAFLSNILNLGSNYTIGIRRRFMQEMTAIEANQLPTCEEQITEYLSFGNGYLQNDNAVGRMMAEHQAADLKRFQHDAQDQEANPSNDAKKQHVFVAYEKVVDLHEQRCKETHGR
jgi:hypothetical protein